MRHDHLYVHAPKSKLVPCLECGNMMEVGYKTRTPKRCLTCSENAEASAIRAMANKFGPEWEKWILSMTAFLSSHAGRGAGDSGNVPR